MKTQSITLGDPGVRSSLIDRFVLPFLKEGRGANGSRSFTLVHWESCELLSTTYLAEAERALENAIAPVVILHPPVGDPTFSLFTSWASRKPLPRNVPVIVPSVLALKVLQERLHNKNVFVVPYPGITQPPSGTADAAGSAHIALSASPRVEERAHRVFDAISRLPLPHRRVAWMTAIEEHDEARKLAAEFRVDVELHSPRSLATWGSLLAHGAVAVHLRVSTEGDLGPFFATSLVNGNVTLVSEFGENDMLSRQLAVPIRIGHHEVTDLRSAFLTAEHLSADESRRRRDAQQLAASELFSPETIAAHFAAAIRAGTETKAGTEEI